MYSTRTALEIAEVDGDDGGHFAAQVPMIPGAPTMSQTVAVSEVNGNERIATRFGQGFGEIVGLTLAGPPVLGLPADGATISGHPSLSWTGPQAGELGTVFFTRDGDHARRTVMTSASSVSLPELSSSGLDLPAGTWDWLVSCSDRARSVDSYLAHPMFIDGDGGFTGRVDEQIAAGRIFSVP